MVRTASDDDSFGHVFGQAPEAVSSETMPDIGFQTRAAESIFGPPPGNWLAKTDLMELVRQINAEHASKQQG